MSLLLLFRSGGGTRGSGAATFTLGAQGTGSARGAGVGIAAFSLGVSGVGVRPPDPGVHEGSGVAAFTLGVQGRGRMPLVTVSTEIWANLGVPAGAWYDLSPDTIVSSFGFNYGLTGNRPSDSLAGSGTLTFSLRTKGHPDGWYSPQHVNCRPGWNAGIEIFVWQSHFRRIPAAGFGLGTQIHFIAGAGHGMAPGQMIHVHGALVDVNFIYRVIAVNSTNVVIDVGTPPGDGLIPGATAIQPGVVRWWGRIDTIDPEPGPAFRRVHVTAYDRMRDLLDADLVNVPIQINQTETQIMAAIFAALDPSVAPRWQVMDAGIDQVPYALDDLGDGARAGAVVADLLRSSYGLGYMVADGIFRYLSRNSRATVASVATLSSSMSGLSASTALGKVYNEIRTTTHPRTIDGANVVLYAATGSAPEVPTGTISSVEGAFRDPNDVLRLIGAASTVAPVAGIDWIANSKADGTGTTLTASTNVAATVVASRVTFAISNWSGVPAFLTTLQLRGQGIYDNGPRSFTARSTQPYGKRTFALDLRNQNVDALGQQIADFALAQYSTLGPQIEEVVLRNTPDSDPAIFAQMIVREIGDVVTITESTTGVSGVTVMILGIAVQALTASAWEVRWRVGPTVILDRPATPTGLTVTNIHDTALRVSWTTATAGSYTQIYLGGVLISTQGIGVTSLDITGLTAATNYSFQVRHLFFGLTSDLSAAVVGRPHVAGTGGSEFEIGGYHYHYFYASSAFVMTVPGRIDLMGVGAGGGGGSYADWTGSGGGPSGGGGGGGGRVVYLWNEEEPAGAHPIVIGAGGVGALTFGQNGTQGGVTTYRVDHMIAVGGGRGAGAANGPNSGGTGGSGGGAAGTGGGSGGNNVGGAGLGFNGGNGGANPGGAIGGGGGGGAGGLGGNGSTTGGAAGLPVISIFNGAVYSGGGVGGRGTLPATGLANSGTGGSGGQSGADPAGRNGGSGFFAVRYPV